MKIICYTCSHGLVPGPYQPWDAAHQDEHRWLLGLCAQELLATHVVLPTEAFTLTNNGFGMDKLAWLCAEVRGQGMTPVVWVDKWLWNRDIGTIRQWLSEAYAAAHPHNPCWNLSNELDLLWLLPPMVDKRDVLQKLAMGKEHLLALGMSPSALWAGGATVEGTLALDALLSPAVLTWTAWRAVLRSVAGGQVYQAVAEDLAAIRAGMLRPGSLAAIEIGWSEASGGDQQQANVMKAALVAAKDHGVTPGLWTGIDWPHDQRDPVESNYGVLNEGGAPKPALQVWKLMS